MPCCLVRSVMFTFLVAIFYAESDQKLIFLFMLIEKKKMRIVFYVWIFGRNISWSYYDGISFRMQSLIKQNGTEFTKILVFRITTNLLDHMILKLFEKFNKLRNPPTRFRWKWPNRRYLFGKIAHNSALYSKDSGKRHTATLYSSAKFSKHILSSSTYRPFWKSLSSRSFFQETRSPSIYAT